MVGQSRGVSMTQYPSIFLLCISGCGISHGIPWLLLRQASCPGSKQEGEARLGLFFGKGSPPQRCLPLSHWLEAWPTLAAGDLGKCFSFLVSKVEEEKGREAGREPIHRFCHSVIMKTDGLFQVVSKCRLFLKSQ